MYTIYIVTAQVTIIQWLHVHNHRPIKTIRVGTVVLIQFLHQSDKCYPGVSLPNEKVSRHTVTCT